MGDVRNKGLLFGVEVVEDKESRRPAAAEKVGKVVSGCQERGLIVAGNADTVAGFDRVLAVAPLLWRPWKTPDLRTDSVCGWGS